MATGESAVTIGVEGQGMVAYARAWVAFLDGRYRRARELAQDAVDPSLGFNRHAALVLSARAALWAGQEARMRADLEAIRTIEAGAAALAGQHSEAAASYRTAIRL